MLLLAENDDNATCNIGLDQTHALFEASNLVCIPKTFY